MKVGYGESECGGTLRARARNRWLDLADRWGKSMDWKSTITPRSLLAVIFLVIAIGLVMWATFFFPRGCGMECQPTWPYSMFDRWFMP
jgi:hypothetical protein